MSALNRVKKMAVAFVKDESGQSLTEYVLLLLIVVMAVKVVGGDMKSRLKGLMDKAFNEAEKEMGP